ncbi:MAG: hypothetical protein RL756_108, partial [Pseudomonadota bacterium]
MRRVLSLGFVLVVLVLAGAGVLFATLLDAAPRTGPMAAPSPEDIAV